MTIINITDEPSDFKTWPKSAPYWNGKPFRLQRGRLRRPAKTRRVCQSSARNAVSRIRRVPIECAPGESNLGGALLAGLERAIYVALY